MPDGNHVWLNGNEPSRGRRYYMTDLEGAKPRPLTPEGVQSSRPGLVLNGRYLAGLVSGKLWLYPVEGGGPQSLPGIREGEQIAGWTQDGKSVFVYSRNEFPYKVYKLDRMTGRRDRLFEAAVTDRAGNTGGGAIFVTPDGKSYAQSVDQRLSELQLVEGIR
jgi:hypothetical protein